MRDLQEESPVPLITFNGVTVQFRGRHGMVVTALEQVDLAINEKEFVSIVGPSGCGKSTLLRLIACLIRPTAGDVHIKGRPLREPSSRIGIMFQQPVLLPWRSVLDNVLFPVELIHQPRAAFETTARELIQTVGLGGFDRAMPRELSGGMQQRVAICRALVYDPPVLLMDEPFAALDALTRDELGIELMRVTAQRDKTVVFVTHSITESILLSDRVVVMSARPGRIIDEIPIRLARPRSLDLVSTPEFGCYASQIRSRIAAAHGRLTTAGPELT